MEAVELFYIKVFAVKGIVIKSDAIKMKVLRGIGGECGLNFFRNEDRAMAYIKSLEKMKLSKRYKIYILTEKQFKEEAEGKLVATI